MSNVRFIVALALVCACGLFVPACGPTTDGCAPAATRCSGQVAEICDGDRHWSPIEDCNDVAAYSGGTWVCCAVADDADASADGGVTVHACVPADECAGGGS